MKMLKEIKSDFNIGSTAYPPFISLSEEQIEWLIKQAEKVERYENSVNLAIAQLEESDSIPFALDALKEGLK
jgi:hypothetical protein